MSPPLPHSAPRRAFIVAFGAQAALLLLHDLGRDPTGHPVQASVIAALAIQLPLYVLPLLGLTALWSLALRLLEFLPGSAQRRSIIATIVGLLGVAMHGSMLGLVVVDLGLQRFRGEPLGWQQFGAYRGGGILNSDWIHPVLDMPGTLITTILILALAAINWRLAVRGTTPTWRECALWVLAMPMAWAPTQLAWYHQRDLMQPAAQRLWRTRGKPAVITPETERGLRDAVRLMLDPARKDRWISDTFPLLREQGQPSTSPSWGQARRSPPDIVVIAIESLRGVETGWGDGASRRAISNTPHLDSLAHLGRRFPHWTAGGDPSPRGFVTLQTGVWEHGQLFIVANFQALHVDAFPLVLRRQGYHSVALWSGTPSFDNQLTFARRWYDETLFDEAQATRWYFRSVPEQVTVDRALDWIRRHDQVSGTRPLLMYYATDATHTPFSVPPGESDPGTRSGRYAAALRETDRQIGRLITALRARPRWANTVVLVVGDHGDRIDDATPPDLRGMPTDAMVVTSGFLYGPPALVGPPGVDSGVVSHADWYPTVRGWFADTSASVWMGHDLMEPRTGPREAIAVDSRGYRLDRDGHTLLVDATDSTRAWSWPSWRSEGSATAPVVAPFSSADPGRLTRAIRYWSMLVEQNRVMPAGRN